MRINEDYVLQEIADEYIVVPVGEASTRLQGVIKLNTTGVFLWNLLRNKVCTESELVEALKANFKVDTDDAKSDIRDFIRQLTDLGCLDK